MRPPPRGRRLVHRGCAALLLLGMLAVAPAAAAEAPVRVGVLMIASSLGAAHGFVEGLRELGRVEGKNLALEVRRDDGRGERLAAHAAELVKAKVRVIYAVGPEAREAARRATTTIPIVMLAGTDPVAEGYAASLARPGGNVTGLTAIYPELFGKQLELMKELLPGLARVGTLWDARAFGPATAPAGLVFVRPMEAGAKALGLGLRFFEVREPADLDGALAAAAREGITAIRVSETGMLGGERGRLAALAVQRKLALFGQFHQSAEAGYLAAYGVSLEALHRRAAGYVDRILKGADPATLPIERPSKLELVVNARTAKALGIALPRSVATRADRVIE